MRCGGSIHSGSGVCRRWPASWRVWRPWSDIPLPGRTKPGAATTTMAICRNLPAPASRRFRISSITVSWNPMRWPPNIVMIHDESSFDIRQANGIKVPAGYGSHFKSYDGKERKFLTESNGGPSWFTEYNVLAGLSSRSFGRFSYFVTRIASGRVERGLPLALRRCGYDTISLYPAYGAFMSARSFQTTTSIQHFYDARDLGARDVEPDSFFYDKALKLMSEET